MSMITKNYIKMCEQAEEIQKAWEVNISDAYFIRSENKELNASYCVAYIEQPFLSWNKRADIKKENIYLPTQEQLQEMMQEKWIYYGSYPLAQFCSWINTTGGPNKFCHSKYKDQCKSIAELWLTFVMHEKYNKVWDSDGWIKEGK